ncbi:hypothetical protein CspeluHIS016_0207390 [Cutaneotrichosporon spelunceum]|uniref:type I protein arginine methyltransferase n=1 Tax=Cutaneotrichosporon spelunceum TaxID=1672016 RepID=A0AAD3TS66_9TREE|nr:hypothetical protein CspeluHIS016_0207390 [Cutaneotrichosporon spelunceum]
MSFTIPAHLPPPSDGSASDSDDGVSDWGSSLGDARLTRALFSETVYPSPEAALAAAKEEGFDLMETASRLELDVYGRMRLINLIRRDGLTVVDVTKIAADDERLKDDQLLIPVVPDDPLLQLDDDEWSDDEEPKTEPASGAAASEIARLHKEVEMLRGIVERTVQGEDEGKGKKRDDDTHYFDSYTHNEIHEIMLKDTTRTVSYARFILSNPRAFRDKIVLDVGAGTGILSMFAAKAGAKHVYAIEASNLASKTRENIRENGLGDVVTVIQGKVEDISLPVDTVDVIVSEWMGYMLLYESMLDSVLVARDRFLAPGGLMAPSQTRLVISAITGDRVFRERIDFWDNVYGYNMSSAMNGVYYPDGVIDIVDRQEVVTSEAVVRDINSHDATPKSLDFHANFELVSTSNKEETVRAFLTHFDTFFSPIPGIEGRVPLSHPVHIHEFADDLYKSEVAPLNSGDVNAVSFTTGPRGQPTHWKQVSFLLRKPFTLAAGQRVSGRFFCRKSAENSRELEVEIHYALGTEPEGYTVQTYKVA